MKMNALMKTFFVLSFMLALAGCVTPYQRTGFTGGFSETRLQENVFSVYFRGNGYTSRERSTDFALLRGAELTMEYGFKFFIISDSTQDTTTSYYNTGGASTTHGTINTVGNTSHALFNTKNSGTTTIPIQKPSSVITFVCFKEKPEGMMAFDANFLANSIRHKYGMNMTPEQTIGDNSLTRVEDVATAETPQLGKKEN